GVPARDAGGPRRGGGGSCTRAIGQRGLHRQVPGAGPVTARGRGAGRLKALFFFFVKRSVSCRTFLLIGAKVNRPKGDRPMTNELSAHPSPERLAAFRVGNLSPEELAETERHVADCPSCCQSLKALPDDSLVQCLREAVTTPELAAGGTPVESKGRTGIWLCGPTSPPLRPEPVLPAELADHPRYRVLELLGVGGMGAVYKAEHRLMERTVALKVIGRHLTDKPGVAERFRREVKAAARLDHPNIVRAYDAERAGDFHFLIMECVEGTTLARLVAKRGPLPVAEACECVRQAALGLQHAFEHGMVHRDVKPQNLMVTHQSRDRKGAEDAPLPY